MSQPHPNVANHQTTLKLPPLFLKKNGLPMFMLFWLYWGLYYPVMWGLQQTTTQKFHIEQPGFNGKQLAVFVFPWLMFLLKD